MILSLYVDDMLLAENRLEMLGLVVLHCKLKDMGNAELELLGIAQRNS